jgi:hypothetical protein
MKTETISSTADRLSWNRFFRHLAWSFPMNPELNPWRGSANLFRRFVNAALTWQCWRMHGRPRSKSFFALRGGAGFVMRRAARPPRGRRQFRLSPHLSPSLSARRGAEGAGLQNGAGRSLSKPAVNLALIPPQQHHCRAADYGGWVPRCLAESRFRDD